MKKTILKMLEELGVDVYFNDYTAIGSNCISVTFNDFDGFDNNWGEVDREYDNPQKVMNFQNFLEEKCSSKEGNFYIIYHFEDFDVQVGYASYDI